MPSRFRTFRFGLLEGVAVACLSIGGILVADGWRLGGASISRESAALVTLRRLASAEDSFKARGTSDTNRDGVGEYGHLEELAAAGALRGWLTPDVEGGAVSGGYRFEVLLPASAQADRRIPLTRSGGRPDPKTSARFFAATAIPDAEEGPVLRSFYLDATGRLYVAEGVTDAVKRRRTPPPALVLEGDEDASLLKQPVWRLVEGARARGAPH